MARAGLGWSIARLADAASVGVATVARFETHKGETIPATLTAIQRALEHAGVEFLAANGLRLSAQVGTKPSSSGPRGARRPRRTGKSAPSQARKPAPKPKR
jgi:transcriptional regulator with XRE-family HTH domain